MNRLSAAAGALAVVVLSMAFASLNSNQRVTLRLGFGTYYGVPLTAIAFGGVIVGMLIMLVAGIRSDLKVRRILRARLEEEDLEERSRFVDHAQQDLFAEDTAPESPVGAPEPSHRRAGAEAVGAKHAEPVGAKHPEEVGAEHAEEKERS